MPWSKPRAESSRVDSGDDASVAEQTSHLFGQRRRTRSAIADVVGVVGGAAVVVDHRWTRMRHDRELVFFPMRRDHQNGVRRRAHVPGNLAQRRRQAGRSDRSTRSSSMAMDRLRARRRRSAASVFSSRYLLKQLRLGAVSARNELRHLRADKVQVERHRRNSTWWCLPITSYIMASSDLRWSHVDEGTQRSSVVFQRLTRAEYGRDAR